MTEAISLDRRQRRRLETIEQVLDVAADVMAEEGVTGLTLGEVARRMGIRPPSLYVYFDSKNALYDALFERGWGELVAAVAPARAATAGADLEARFQQGQEAFVRWAVEHPAYTPLMLWRPVPGFAPSAKAYAPAVEMVRQSREFLAEMQRDGVLGEGADLDVAFRTLTALISGVITQQLTNAPHEPFESGEFTSTLPALMEMWLAHYRRRP